MQESSEETPGKTQWLLRSSSRPRDVALQGLQQLSLLPLDRPRHPLPRRRAWAGSPSSRCRPPSQGRSLPEDLGKRGSPGRTGRARPVRQDWRCTDNHVPALGGSMRSSLAGAGRSRTVRSLERVWGKVLQIHYCFNTNLHSSKMSLWLLSALGLRPSLPQRPSTEPSSWLLASTWTVLK